MHWLRRAFVSTRFAARKAAPRCSEWVTPLPQLGDQRTGRGGHRGWPPRLLLAFPLHQPAVSGCPEPHKFPAKPQLRQQTSGGPQITRNAHPRRLRSFSAHNAAGVSAVGALRSTHSEQRWARFWLGSAAACSRGRGSLRAQQISAYKRRVRAREGAVGPVERLGGCRGCLSSPFGEAHLSKTFPQRDSK